ncbi:MAG: hypothetical protein MJ105_07025 [Lachnospiraceae bacterium]|nr:hypothetical protein [Lachnospiraceae bacterium]
MKNANTNQMTLSIDKKYALTIEEASVYFSIGETNLREICRNDVLNNTFTCKVKSKTVIIREKFEKHMVEHHVLLAG